MTEFVNLHQQNGMLMEIVMEIKIMVKILGYVYLFYRDIHKNPKKDKYRTCVFILICARLNKITYL